MTCSGIMIFREASPLGLPYTLSRAPLRRRAPFAWLGSLRFAREARSPSGRSWDRHRAEELLQDFVGVHVLGLGPHRPGDAMAGRVAEDLFDILRQRPRTPVQERGHARQG